jgi:hypothetical protein
LHDVLGDHQDSTATRQVLRDYGMRGYGDGENALAYGMLYARRHTAVSTNGINRVCAAKPP